MVGRAQGRWQPVALRKESVDRNWYCLGTRVSGTLSLSARRAWIEILASRLADMSAAVALRKESVDRNSIKLVSSRAYIVALRKESVDRNTKTVALEDPESVALRKESVDRNGKFRNPSRPGKMSLSARRAWIEISTYVTRLPRAQGRSPQGERG